MGEHKKNHMERWQLDQRLSLPLDAKIQMSLRRIRAWYDRHKGQVYVAFSGGKDSTVLLHLVRSIYPHVPAVYCDTGLEYPEIKRFVNKQENVEVIRPPMSFKEVLTTYGYPVVSKEQAKYIREMQRGTTEYTSNKRLNGVITKKGYRSGMISKKWQYLINAPFKISEQCCDIMKKRPFHQYTRRTGRYPFIGSLVGEGGLRRQSYLRYGCNMVDGRNPSSRPMMFWQEQDVLRYLVRHDLKIADVYGELRLVLEDQEAGNFYEVTGVQRTVCVYCIFGVHLEKPENRFQKLYRTHPDLWKYCMEDLGLKDILEYMDIPCK